MRGYVFTQKFLSKCWFIFIYFLFTVSDERSSFLEREHCNPDFQDFSLSSKPELGQSFQFTTPKSESLYVTWTQWGGLDFTAHEITFSFHKKENVLIIFTRCSFDIKKKQKSLSCIPGSYWKTGSMQKEPPPVPCLYTSAPNGHTLLVYFPCVVSNWLLNKVTKRFLPIVTDGRRCLRGHPKQLQY